MQKMNLNDRESKQVFIIKNKYRFKVKAGYYNNLVEFFKRFDGRYYDNETTEWSFPSESLDSIKAFLNKNSFVFKEMEANQLVRISISDKEVLMSFEAFVHDFSIFKVIEGAFYEREISKYIIPKRKFDQLEAILMENKFNFLITENRIATLNFFPETEVEKRSIDSSKDGRTEAFSMPESTTDTYQFDIRNEPFLGLFNQPKCSYDVTLDSPTRNTSTSVKNAVYSLKNH
jgi:hypothetical protein